MTASTSSTTVQWGLSIRELDIFDVSDWGGEESATNWLADAESESTDPSSTARISVVARTGTPCFLEYDSRR
jgi:hypothetical protein